MTFVPHFRTVGGEDRPLTAFVLHGILGSSQNWRLYIGKMANLLPDWRFVLIDLRNHGDSGTPDPPHTLEACARDVHAVAEALDVLPAAVIGHSFGGKVAYTYAGMYPEGLAQVWALDIVPDSDDWETAARNSDVVKVLNGLREVPTPIPSRKWLIDHLQEKGFTRQLARWMTTNLRERTDEERQESGDDARFAWTFNLDGVEEMLDHYLQKDLWPWLEEDHGAMEVHLVRAGKSTRWNESHVERLVELEQRGRVHFHTLEDAGHWVHVDDPDGLMALLEEFLG